MQKVFLLLTIICLILGCGQTGKNISDKKETSSASIDDNYPGKIYWFDSLLIKYINQTNNELIKYARKDTIPVEWLLDRVENTDSAKYLIFHIGHDVIDSGNVNKRFVTDGWVYIDSLTKKIYEYDLPNESLIEWNK